MNPREKLYDWICKVYQGRLIRISGEPYLHHLIFVAEFADGYVPFGYEIGLCHDLLEDIDIDQNDFTDKLAAMGYAPSDAHSISATVCELTSVYTKNSFPLLSKNERRKMEDKRLGSIGAVAQTVKYGDLIYNAQWTVKYEPRKAQKYLRRKLKLIRKLDKANRDLRQRASTYLKHLLS